MPVRAAVDTGTEVQSCDRDSDLRAGALDVRRAVAPRCQDRRRGNEEVGEGLSGTAECLELLYSFNGLVESFRSLFGKFSRGVSGLGGELGIGSREFSLCEKGGAMICRSCCFGREEKGNSCQLPIVTKN